MKVINAILMMMMTMTAAAAAAAAAGKCVAFCNANHLIFITEYHKTSNRSPRLLLEHVTYALGLCWRPGFDERPGFYLNIDNFPF